VRGRERTGEDFRERESAGKGGREREREAGRQSNVMSR